MYVSATGLTYTLLILDLAKLAAVTGPKFRMLLPIFLSTDLSAGPRRVPATTRWQKT